jgi:hypothetical protein
MWIRVVGIGILLAALLVPPTIDVSVTSRMSTPVLLRFEDGDWRALAPGERVSVPITRWRWNAFEWRRGDPRDPIETGQAVPLPLGHMLLRAGTSFVLIESGLGGVDT